MYLLNLADTEDIQAALKKNNRLHALLRLFKIDRDARGCISLKLKFDGFCGVLTC
jgi:hypothetical protein